MNYKFNEIISLPPGKHQGFWELIDIPYKIPFTYIKGEKNGKKICISSGIHCCEYIGIIAAQEVAQEIDFNEVIGEIIILHPVNYTGFFKKLPAVFPEDGKNLNRQFPGKKNGTETEKIAYNFSNDLYKYIDFFLDLHGGDLHEDITPLVYCPGIGQEEIIKISMEVGAHLSVPIRVISSSTTGAYNSAAIQGTPALLLERGGCGLWNENYVNEDKIDIYTVLKFFEVYEKGELKKKEAQLEIRKAKYIDSEWYGFWFPQFRPGEKAKKGEILGKIKDSFGKEVKVITADFDCIILYETVSLAIKKEEPLITYGQV